MSLRKMIKYIQTLHTRDYTVVFLFGDKSGHRTYKQFIVHEIQLKHLSEYVRLSIDEFSKVYKRIYDYDKIHSINR
jgi:hypothetical protein